jgi:tetratricopeptide (TPR) repeat protein
MIDKPMPDQEGAMQKTLAAAIFLIILLLLNYNPAFAGGPCGCYCGVWLPAPCSDDACKRACGWKEPKQSSPPSQSPTYTPQQPQYDYEAERQRQEEKKKLEEQKKKEEEEAKKRQEEFKKNKEEALKLLKGAESGEFGLKGVDTGGDLGLKGVDSSTVDLRHLDPNKPITVDPNVVKGNPRQIPVQISDKTLNNKNYMNGFDAIKGGNPSLAVQYFKKALTELPDDLLVKNALAFAEDLMKVRQKKAQDKKYVEAYEVASKGMSAWVFDNDYSAALAYFKQANAINPKDQGIRDAMNFLEGLNTGLQQKATMQSPEERAREEMALKLAGHSIVAIQRRDYDSAILILEDALSINPKDKGISDALDTVKGWRDEALKTKNKQKNVSGKGK